MRYAQLTQWLNDLTDSWERKDVGAALKLFDTCEVYKEDPFAQNAALNPGGIETLWLEILRQSDITVTATPLAIEGDVAVARYSARYNVAGIAQVSSGIWAVGFEAGQCRSFEQWYMVGKKARENG